MAIPLYLAMTAGEIASCGAFPAHMGYMACHFSPDGTGLCDLPDALPARSLLILNDRMPIRGHDPACVADTLLALLPQLEPAALLLDFQRPDDGRAGAMAEYLRSRLPCPVGVSEGCGQTAEGPIFLPPVPLNQLPEAYLSRYSGREIWLEAALDGAVVTLDMEGSRASPLPPDAGGEFPHKDDALHCRYRIERHTDRVDFLMRRTPETLDALLAAAEHIGVTMAVGLYQELALQAPPSSAR
ncbi:MAG: hypothetical protein LUJ09_04470 [Firmicutes bacterium]|nr:hypothetical protein [Bacillota bacterium]